MRYLKTNTATIVTVGPFLDKTDGVTLETALTITNERISFTVDLNDGSAPTLVLDNVTGATSGTSNDLNYITNNDAGLMQLELAAANVNYLGRAFLIITDAANHCPVFHEFTILPAMVYDSLIAGTDVLQADMTQILGTAVSSPATAGVLDVNLKNIANAAVSTSTAQLGVNAVQAGGTAWGSGAITAASIATGAITNAKFAAGAIDAAAIADSAIDNATFAADVGSTAYATNKIGLAADKAVQNAALATAANLATLTGYVDTEVAAILAAVDTEVAAIKTKTDFLPSATAGAAGGLFIAGTNAATSITTALTANITGNLSGSVGSVTGAVGSVTGAVGSVTGAVGSVTGNVGGSVASVAANGITATSIAADAINAAAVKADAVTKIQNGLATPTNITAGTITTVTNLTNAPTNGDLTATMKASVTTAATAATPTAAAVTGAVGSVTAPVTAGTVSDKTGYALSSAGVQAIWDALTSAFSTIGSIGKRIADNLDATISSRGTSTYAGGDTSGTTTLLGRIIGTLATGTHNPQTGDTYARIGAAGAGLTALGDTRLANLDATVSSRSTYAGGAVASVTGNVGGNVVGSVGSVSGDTKQTADVATLITTVGVAGAGLTALATQASVNTIDDFLDTEIAAILADTNELQTDLVNGGRLDLLIDAIKAKTDNLPASPAAVGSAMTLTVAYDAAKTAATQTSVDDLPTNAELATALGTADDATLAAIAALNNLSSAQAQSAATAALNAYDPPTNTEMEARTLVAANYATAAALTAVDDFVDTEVAAIKAVTDKLDTALVLDGAVYQLTANALELAPTGSGSGATAQEVWEYAGGTGRTINSVSGSVGGKVLGGGSDAITGIGASTQLADGVVHGGTTAELTLKNAVLSNLDNQGIALSLRGGNPASPGHAIALLDENGTLGTGRIRGYIDGVVNGVALATEAITGAAFDATGLQAVADALKLAPTAGDPATGSVYDALAVIAAMMGSVVSGGDVHLGTLAGYSDDAGGRGSDVSFSDTWDAQSITPNTAGGYNPPGDFGAIRFALDTGYDSSKPLSSVVLRIGAAGESNCGVKIELLAAPPPLWGTVWNERLWGTTVFTLTGSGYTPAYHDFDITALFSELLAALPVGSSITAVCIGIYPTGGNSPTIYFTEGGYQPSLIVSEAYVISAATKQSVADAGLLAPSAGTPATGSMYDLLIAPANEPAQLDWRAWETPGGALKDLYDDNAIDVLTGLPSDYAATDGAEYFGSYVMREFDGSLFVGISNLPMNGTGAIIARLDTPGGTPVFEYNLPEEGVSCMAVNPAGTALYATGVDVRDNTERCGFYKRDLAGTWTRRNTLRLYPSEDGFQHVTGIVFVGSRIYVCGQAIDTAIAWSDDDGITWNYSSHVTPRAYSIGAIGTQLYVLGSYDGALYYELARETEPGWADYTNPISTQLGVAKNQMVNWGDYLLFGVDTDELISVDAAGTVVSHSLPFVLRQTYNNLAVDTDGYLCALGTTGVWRTNDLTTWKQVWSFSPADTMRSLGTWGDNLVVSTDGATAQVLARPASPEAAQQQMTRDALKLAASPGAAATGSTDADIDAISLKTAALPSDPASQSDVETAISGLALSLSEVDGALDDIYGYLYGNGPITFEYVLTSEVDDVTPLANVRVRVTTDAAGKQFVCENYTNDQGAVVFHLSAGTFYFFRYRHNTRFSINPDVEVIS